MRRWLVLFFALAFPTLAEWLYFGLSLPPDLVRTTMLVCKVLQFSLPAIAAGWLLPRKLAFSKPTSLQWCRGLGVGAGLALLICGLYIEFFRHSPFIAQMPALIAAKLEALGCASLPAFLTLAVGISVFHSGLEEYYWRWFVFDELTKKIPVSWAAPVSALGFTAHHVLLLHMYLGAQAPLWVLIFLSTAVFIGGLLWAFLFQRGRSIYECWISHALVDGALMLLGYDLVFANH